MPRGDQKTPDGCPTKAERVEQMRQLMLAGRWVNGKTTAQLATKWGRARKTLDRESAEASRSIRRGVQETSEVRARIGGILETIVSSCMSHGSDGRLLRTAVEALRTLADVTGAKAPHIQIQYERDLEAVLEIIEEEAPPDVAKRILARIAGRASETAPDAAPEQPKPANVIQLKRAVGTAAE